MKTKTEIMLNALRIRDESEQIFTDCDYWNRNVRKEHEQEINPDENGELRRLIIALNEMLSKELWCVHVLGMDELFAAPSLGEATKRAAELNKFIDEQEAAHPEYPKAKAVLAIWTDTKENHAKDVLKWNDRE